MQDFVNYTVIVTCSKGPNTYTKDDPMHQPIQKKRIFTMTNSSLCIGFIGFFSIIRTSLILDSEQTLKAFISAYLIGSV